ncbi:MAG: hypothetical protein HW416_3014, partial [Chloroflexi bacterium]|nr:hypothetical protein [Chloroflexota bacterium]
GYWAPGFIEGPQNWHFFPAYGWAVARLSLPFGGPPAAPAVGVAFSLFCMVIGLLVVRQLARDMHIPDLLVVALLLAYPSSFFLNAVYTESMVLASTAIALLAARRRKLWVAGLAAAVATLTRGPGILLLLPIGIIWLDGMRTRPRPWLAAIPLTLPIAALGLLMVIIGNTTGDPLAFVHDLPSWNRSSALPWETLAGALRRPFADVHPSTWYLTPVDTAAALLGLATSAYLIWRRQFALGVYGLALVALPLSSGLVAAINRYTLVNIPMFLVLASITGRREWLRTSVLIGFATLLGLETALFAVGVHSID